MSKKVLITGATGKQGGALARHLKGFEIRALTRKPDSDSAKALTQNGAELVKGDLDDAESLKRALDGVWGVFAVQNTWEAGVEKEEEQGKRIATLAKEQGVQHFVYSSVGSAHKHTGIPHFENKFRVEETVRGLGFPSYTIWRPVFFMENLVSPWFLQGDKLVTAMKPETRLQMIASDDIGKVVAIGFTRADELNRAEIDIGADTHTMPEIATILSEARKEKITFQPIPNEMVRKNSADFAIMLDWFDRVGYSADIEGVQKRFSVKFRTLREFLAA
jgi:uncharacterized protein YbjT (DUF2867 family)